MAGGGRTHGLQHVQADGHDQSRDDFTRTHVIYNARTNLFIISNAFFFDSSFLTLCFQPCLNGLGEGALARRRASRRVR